MNLILIADDNTLSSLLLWMHFDVNWHCYWLPQWVSSKESASSAGDAGGAASILGLEDTLGDSMTTHSSILFFFFFTPVFTENPMHRRDWQAKVHRVAKSQTRLKWLSMHAWYCYYYCDLLILLVNEYSENRRQYFVWFPLSLEIDLFSSTSSWFCFWKAWFMFCSVQSLSCVQLFAIPWTAAGQASLSITNSQHLLKVMSIKLVMPSNHLILCHPLLLLSSIFPSIRVFSSESILHIRWPKYWSLSFSVSPFNEYSGLISVRMDWLGLLAAQGTLNSLLQPDSSKTSVLQHSPFFMVQLSYTCDYWTKHRFD